MPFFSTIECGPVVLMWERVTAVVIGGKPQVTAASQNEKIEKDVG